MNTTVLELENPRTETPPIGVPRPDGEGVAARVTIEVLETDEALLKHKRQWEEFVDAVPATIFQTFDWVNLWWLHFGTDPNRSLYVCVVHADNNVVGIVPFFRETRRIAGFPISCRLRLLGCGVSKHGARAMFDRYSPSDFLDALVDPAYAKEVAVALQSHLAANITKWDELDLSNLREDGFFLNEFLPLLGQFKNRLTVAVTDVCPYLVKPVPSKEFLLTLRSSVRRRMSSSTKAFENEPNTRVETPHTESDVDQVFHDLIDLHQIRWNNMGYAGVFSDERFTRFQEEVTRVFYKNGWLWLKSVRINGVNMAAGLAYSFKGRMYSYLSGFDDQAPSARKRPGIGLLMLMIEDSAVAGGERFEFLRGAESYKFELTNLSSTISSLRLRNPYTSDTLRSIINEIQEQLESLSYRAFIETSSLRMHLRNTSILSGVTHYISFRWKCLKDSFHVRFEQKTSVTS